MEYQQQTPGLKRRSCERCRQLKRRCDRTSSDAPCTLCVTQNAECVRKVRKPPTREDKKCEWSLILGRRKQGSARHDPTSLPTPPKSTHSSFSPATTCEPFFPDGMGFLSEKEKDMLPDVNRLLFDVFSELNHPRKLPVEFLQQSNLHRLLATTPCLPMHSIDPLESHRLAITDHLQNSQTALPSDIEWLTLQHLRQSIIAYFRHCHRHLPIIHLPSWDIARIPTSLVVVQAIMGSRYLPAVDSKSFSGKRLLADAFSLIFKVDNVCTVLNRG
jgi:Fungal Zn(2)-Cys(6) binuclear cluster domain